MKLSIIRVSVLIIFILSFIGCSQKQPMVSKSATILFKTPNMKFYDKGFVTKYDDHIDLQIFNAGTLVLKLLIYKDEICQNSFKCIDSKQFNKEYLSTKYNNDFLYNLFLEEKVYFRDNKNHILIKVF